MLDSLRSFAGSPIGIIVFGALIVGLLFFGLGGFGGTGAVATVGSQQITQQQFADAYDQQIRQLGFITPARALAEGLPQQVVNGLVQAAALADQADNLGMGLTDAAVAQAIAADPFFQSDGVFNPATLDNYLRQTGLTERELIDDFRAGMITNQLLVAVRGSEAIMPESYRRILNDYFGEQRVVRYAVLSPAMLEPGADPTDEELLTYYEENPDRWQVGETRQVMMLELSPRVLADLDAVTDDEIRAEYDARARQAERRNVWQYVFTGRDGATAAERAASVGAMLEAGTSFDELVAAGEITPNDLGLVSAGGLIDPAMAEAAFAIEAGESRIIEGRFGPTLVHVSEISTGDLPPFEEIAVDIRREIAEGRTFARISDLTTEIDETRDTGAALAEVGRILDLPTREVIFDIAGNDGLGNPVPDLPGGTALVTRIFEADVGAAPAPVAITGTNGGVWFEVLEIMPPRQLELAEIRDRVLEEWRGDTDALRLQSLAESVVGLLQNDEPIEQIETEIGVVFQLSGPLNRTSPPPADATGALVQAAFGGDEGFAATVPGAAEGTLIVQEVVEVITPAFDPAAEQPAETQTTADAIGGDMTFGYVVDLQINTPISVNMSLVRRIIGAE
jgi:peptidyl-prolyl cis-trans isomerase D